MPTASLIFIPEVLAGIGKENESLIEEEMSRENSNYLLLLNELGIRFFICYFFDGFVWYSVELKAILSKFYRKLRPSCQWKNWKGEMLVGDLTSGVLEERSRRGMESVTYHYLKRIWWVPVTGWVVLRLADHGSGLMTHNYCCSVREGSSLGVPCLRYFCRIPMSEAVGT